MNFEDIPVPEVYEESDDFRLFLKWFKIALSRIKYDSENIINLYDPLKCPSNLLWLLCDTMGYKFDDRLPVAFNRLVLLYFMSMIYNRGSRTGMMIAAELNVAQFNINKYGAENEELFDRLEDTTIPVNSAYVTSVPDSGYIDVVYLSTEKPVDSCIEYVRPLGMYCFQNAGVSVDASAKISVDARLTDSSNMSYSVGPTKVGRYRRSDFATLQKMFNEEEHLLNVDRPRHPWYYRNIDYEKEPMKHDHPGYRTLNAFQLSNNEHIVEALLPDPIFKLGYDPQDVEVKFPESYLDPRTTDRGNFNLTYNKTVDDTLPKDVTVLDETRPDQTVTSPKPKIAPIMSVVGDAIALDQTRTHYTQVDESGHIVSEGTD